MANTIVINETPRYSLSVAGDNELQLTLNGPAGPVGATGATGAAGPNTITTSTTTNLTGLLKGDGSTVSAATAGTDYATAAQGTDERVPTAAGLTDKFSTAKATIADNDRVAILDSAASNAPKHSLWSLVKSTLKTYFDTIYAAGVHTHVSADITDSTEGGRSLLTSADVTADLITFLQGAEEDPAKIGEEFLPDEIDFVSINFEDGSGEIKEDGDFTSAPDGNLYRHNGVDVGGLLYAPRRRNTIKVNAVIPQERIRNAIDWVMATGTILTDGTVAVTITSSLVTGSPLTVEVDVEAGDEAFMWAEKVRVALMANSDINTHYEVTRVACFLQMRELVYTGTNTFSIALANGTATGVTSRTSINVSTNGTFVELGRFLIPASEAVIGKQFFLTGEVYTRILGSMTSGCKLCLAPDGNRAGIGNGSADSISAYYSLLHDPAGGVSNVIKLNSLFVLSDISGSQAFRVAPSTLSFRIERYDKTTGEHTGMTANSLQSSTTPSNPESIPFEIQFGVIIPVSVDNVSSYITADVTLETLP